MKRLTRRAALYCALCFTLLACSHAPLRNPAPNPASNPPLHSNPAPVSVSATADKFAPSHYRFPHLSQAAPAALLNRLSFGLSPASLLDIESAGIENWLNRQLGEGQSSLPPAVQAQIDAMQISRLSLPQLVSESEALRQEAKQENMTPEQARAAKKDYQQELRAIEQESAARSLYRALYSKRQLEEQMVWFWRNHFNLFGAKHNLRLFLADYEDQALRPHAMGRFADVLRAATLHPAMLRYLDNEHNAQGRINENHARELMELHSLGVDGGYSQRDVQELARILTGFGVVTPGREIKLKPHLQAQYRQQGMFEFNPQRHDMGRKQLLGQTIEGSGSAEMEQALQILARHPAAARFICNKLARHFVADQPPPQLLEKMQQAWRASDGQIRAVLAAMFDSAEFAQALNGKFRNPQEYMLASLRLLQDGRTVSNPQPMLNWLQQLGQPLYGKQTPDGYAEQASAWNSPAQMLQRFDLAKTLAQGSPQLFQQARGGKSAAIDSANLELARKLAAQFGAPSRQALLAAKNPQEWTVFFLASPEMMQR